MKIMREIITDYRILSSDNALKYLKEFVDEDREYLVVLGLNTKNQPVYREIIAIGTLNSCILHPREVFKKAIMMSCKSIIMAHNHPSGCSKSSIEDQDIYEQLSKGGDILGIKLIDSIIITKNGYYSKQMEGDEW